MSSPLPHPPQDLLPLAMIGPVTESWGGERHLGGVSAYVQGLASAIAGIGGVKLSLLADNTNAARPPTGLSLPDRLQLAVMCRLAGRAAPTAVAALGGGRLAKMAWRLATLNTYAIPLAQKLRYVDRAANYDRFLRQARPDLIHVAHAEFRQFLCQRIVRSPLPIVASVLSATIFLRSSPEWLTRMTKDNFDSAARLLPCSNFVKEAIRPYVARPERMVVIPNGTDASRFRLTPQAEARTALGLAPDEFIVLFTGGLIVPKGVHLLTKAFAQSFAQRPGTRLVFVGKGPEAASIQKMASELGIGSQVTLTGFRPDDELPAWYAACDVFALPSQSEGLSGSLLEAMATGKPVVTTYPDLGAHDAVEDGVNGFLVHFGDADALAAALEKLYQSPELAQRMGIEARWKIESTFDWPNIARQVKQIYNEVLAE